LVVYGLTRGACVGGIEGSPADRVCVDHTAQTWFGWLLLATLALALAGLGAGVYRRCWRTLLIAMPLAGLLAGLLLIWGFHQVPAYPR
jgi:hypothetical protein